MRRLASVAVLALALGVTAVGLVTAEANAGAAYDSPYTYEQTFGTALRLVRVDLGMKVTEKDVEHGYILFEYTSPESGKRVSQGSIEIVGAKRGVHVAVQLPSMPQYHEQMILDGLVKKLSTEHGEPPRREAPPAPAPVPDAGPDGSAAD
ncbi:hypothetical protein [Chondromyces crocatus]|uniref:Uncharacterized protein n=1 Tax=Chondromyces crocatus TaxID=52 RepID=A0A0K1EBS5_CHOCO|nr:hypothetical protein [Chondromyces crocatus]AKT38028.1 uncharacterized protein CMC5_021690 [Chondromyces crocatus]